MSSSGTDVTTETQEATVAEKAEAPSKSAQAEAPPAATAEAATPKTESVKPEAVSSADLKEGPLLDPTKMGILNDVNIAITIEVGRAQVKIRDLLNLTKGSIIELDKLSGEPVEVFANGKFISLGEIITVNGKYCVRLSSFKETMQIGAKPNGK